MKDPIIIALGVLVRYALVMLSARLAPYGMSSEEASALSSPEMVAYTLSKIGEWLVPVGVIIYALWSRLRARMMQKLALEMPKGETAEDLDEAAKEQPPMAILTTEPTDPKP